MIDIAISSFITVILMLINYISASVTSDIFIGIPSIGGEGNGKSGFGIWVLYELNEIRFDCFTLTIHFCIVLTAVATFLLVYKSVKILMSEKTSNKQ